MYYDAFSPSDYLHLLSELEQVRLASFSHINRKREFVATRILKHQLFGYKKIEYTDSGAPFIEHEGYISISHTKGCCAIGVSEEFKIGLDLELRSDKAQKLYSKFLNEEELRFLDPTDPLTMTCAWSCKESLYKLAGRKQLIFKTDLLLIDKNGDMWKTKIRNPDHIISVDLVSILRDPLIITINTSAIEIITTS